MARYSKKVQKRKILMVAPEIVPLVKVGGLADVVGALSKILSEKGHDVRVIVPKYAGISHVETAQPLPEPLTVKLGGHLAYARVWKCMLPESDVICYLLEYDKYFDHSQVYGGGPYQDERDDGYRFTFFSRAAIDLCSYLKWIPDLLHCHDWTTGLIPAYLNTTDFSQPIGRAATVLSLHNMQHQGYFERNLMDFAGLPLSLFRADGLESFGQLNMLKGGIYHSTKLSTVSPTYAREIQEPENGWGLDPVLRFRSADLIGVINGVDDSEWNPAEDPLLPANYSASDLTGKSACKIETQRMYGLEVDVTIPLFVVIARLYAQKGIDLLVAITEQLMKTLKLQIAVLGMGESWLESSLIALQKRYPGRFAVHIGFNHKLSHLTTAAADFLLMPSRFEPCGLSQMYSMLYGAPPIVRATGGLKDSVKQYIQGDIFGIGTGFKFEQATSEALYGAVNWACSTYYNRPEEYARVQQNGMLSDFSWEASAKTYEDIYRWAIDTRKGAFSD